MTLTKTALKSIAFAAFLGASTAAVAESTDLDDCAFDGMLAETFMIHRQKDGWDVNTMMKKFGSEPGLRAIIIDAYSYPLMQTAKHKDAVIKEFRNKWSVRCYREGPAIPRKTSSSD